MGFLLSHTKLEQVNDHLLQLVEEGGFEPPKRNATDLQSAPFGHSGTPPNIKLWSWWTDSNPRPADYKSAALPAELHQHLQCGCPTARGIIAKFYFVVKEFSKKVLKFLLRKERRGRAYAGGFSYHPARSAGQSVGRGFVAVSPVRAGAIPRRSGRAVARTADLCFMPVPV